MFPLIHNSLRYTSPSTMKKTDWCLRLVNGSRDVYLFPPDNMRHSVPIWILVLEVSEVSQPKLRMLGWIDKEKWLEEITPQRGVLCANHCTAKWETNISQKTDVNQFPRIVCALFYPWKDRMVNVPAVAFIYSVFFFRAVLYFSACNGTKTHILMLRGGIFFLSVNKGEIHYCLILSLLQWHLTVATVARPTLRDIFGMNT